MNIVTGASGQVGAAIATALLKKGSPVKGVVRNPDKGRDLAEKGIEVAIADLFDREALTNAFRGGDTVFVLTPENPHSQNVITDTKTILKNYREAVLASGVKKIVGLSSLGAQHPSGTGNLQFSHMLEHAFEGLPVRQVFVRPAYYYSNWMLYFETAKETGVLPTFFPPDLEIPMVSPLDVAGYIAKVMAGETEQEKVYELTGPSVYSPAAIARIFGNILHRTVEVQQIPRAQWQGTLLQYGFSENVAENFIDMTTAVIEGKTKPETGNTVQLPTSFESYLQRHQPVTV